MSKTMAEVLNEADEKWSKEVGVSTPAEWADYIAAALSAAGFGVVADAKAEALKEAADALERVDRIAATPINRVTPEEEAEYMEFANSNGDKNWLRARAKSLRTTS